LARFRDVDVRERNTSERAVRALASVCVQGETRDAQLRRSERESVAWRRLSMAGRSADSAHGGAPFGKRNGMYQLGRQRFAIIRRQPGKRDIADVRGHRSSLLIVGA
jgi:hypothetical protein